MGARFLWLVIQYFIKFNEDLFGNMKCISYIYV